MPPKQAQSSSSSQGGVAAGVNVKALEIGRHIPAPLFLYQLLLEKCFWQIHHASRKVWTHQAQSWVRVRELAMLSVVWGMCRRADCLCRLRAATHPTLLLVHRHAQEAPCQEGKGIPWL